MSLLLALATYGTTAHTADTTEVVTAAHTQAGGLAVTVARAEPLTSADSQGVVQASPVSLSETVTTTDSQGVTFAAVSATVEATTGADTQTAGAAFLAAGSEAGSGADTQDAGAIATGATTETALGTDTQTALAQMAGAVVETHPDPFAANTVLLAPFSTTITGGDLTGRGHTFSIGAGTGIFIDTSNQYYGAGCLNMTSGNQRLVSNSSSDFLLSSLIASGFTVEFWFKPVDIFCAIISIGGGTGIFSLTYGSNGFNVTLTDGNGVNPGSSGATGFGLGVWYFIRCTYEPTGKRVSLSVNGSHRLGQTMTITAVGTSNTIYLGNPLGVIPFGGLLQDLRITNKHRSSDSSFAVPSGPLSLTSNVFDSSQATRLITDSRTESASAIDTSNWSGGGDVVYLDSASMLDVQLGGLNLSVSSTDGASADSSATVVFSMSATTQDAAVGGHTQAVELGMSAGAAEAGSASDVANAVSAVNVTLSEPVTASHTQNGVAAFLASLAEAATASALEVGSSAMQVSGVEAVVSIDLSTTSLSQLVSSTESAVAVHSQSASAQVLASLLESGTASHTQTFSYSVFVGTSESSTMVDSAVGSFVFTADLVEVVPALHSQSATVALLASAIEVTFLADSPSALAAFRASASEAAVAQELITGLLRRISGRFSESISSGSLTASGLSGRLTEHIPNTKPE